MTKKIKYFSIIFFLLLSLRVFSQESPYAAAALDSNTIVIGKRANMRVEVKTQANERVFWPEIPAQLMSSVEIVDRSSVDTIVTEEHKLYRQTLAITSFDTGFYALPPIRFSYFLENDTTTYYTQTASVWLEVETVKIDTAKTFYDIKPLMQAPITLREILTYVGISAGIFVGVGILVVLAILLIRKLTKKEIRFSLLPQKPKVPAHITALENLETLRLKKLWQSKKIKEYYSELTAILRVYIEHRFGIQAIEMTTDEILSNLKHHAINDEVMGKLSGILQTADFVKFAKASPPPLENDNVLTHSVYFVQETQMQPDSTKDNPEPLTSQQNDEPQNVAL